MDSFTQTHIYLFNYFLLFTFLFSFFTFSYGQVKIKEKVEIKPKTKVVNNKTFNTTTSTHTIKAVFDWDSSGITHQDLRAKITLISYECKFDTFKSEYGYNGHEEVETSTDLAGTYIVQVNTQANNYYTTHDSTWFDFRIGGKTWFFVDGKKIDGSSGSIRPWRSDLVFTPDKGALCPGEAIDYEIGDSNNTCKNIKWSAVADQITLSVIQGAQYISFYDVSGQNLGTTISGLEENINKYQLKYDNPNTATNKDEKVILEVTVNGISTRDTLIVYPKSNNYFVNGEIKDNVQRIVENEKLTMQAWLESGGICGGKIESSDNTTYTAEIIQGAEYGELLNPKNDAKGDSLGGIVAENDKISIDFYANGTIPANDKEIKVRISNSKENTQPLELSFLVGPSDIVVTFEPKELAAGDTANVIIKHRKEDGTLENFPNDQDYEVRLIEGNDYGTILSSNGADTSDYFESVSDGIKFITYKDIDTNNVEVRIKVSTFYFPLASAQESGNKGNNNVNGVAFIEQIYGFGSAVIDTTSQIDILLGETKYFQAKKNSTTNKLKIVEVKPDANGVPQQKTGDAGNGWTWITTDNWNNPPLKIDTFNSTGKRLGVFYDKFYATVFTTDTTKPQRHNLDAGLIRVIGRFWSADSTYVSWLSLTKDGATDSIKIKIIKPRRLGSKDSTVVGPNNKTWNLDTLIIKSAGKTGILPQIIKGIIKTESVGFHPSYRYEPFSDLYSKGVRANFDSTHKYWIKSSADLGNPTIPSHSNLYIGTGDQIDGYPGYQVVWDYYSEYESSLYKRKFYPKEKKRYKKMYDKKIDSVMFVNNVDSIAAIPITKPLAEARYKSYLKYEIGGIGMDSTIAQTRIAASYGLMQLTYFSGVYKFDKWWPNYNYPNNDSTYLPENINLPDVNVKYGTLHFLGNLRYALGHNIIYTEADTWPANYFLELSYWYGLRNYNGGNDYPNKVFLNTQNYLPEK